MECNRGVPLQVGKQGGEISAAFKKSRNAAAAGVNEEGERGGQDRHDGGGDCQTGA